MMYFFLGVFALIMLIPVHAKEKRKRENELMREHRLAKAKAWKARQ